MTLSNISFSVTHAGPPGREIRINTLSYRLENLNLAMGANREASFRTSITLSSGIAQSVLSDLYRQLVLGNYTRLDGMSGRNASRVLNRKYPDNGSLPGFVLKSGKHNAGGLIVYNLLAHPGADETGYRVLACLLKELLSSSILDKPVLDGSLDSIGH